MNEMKKLAEIQKKKNKKKQKKTNKQRITQTTPKEKKNKHSRQDNPYEQEKQDTVIPRKKVYTHHTLTKNTSTTRPSPRTL